MSAMHVCVRLKMSTPPLGLVFRTEPDTYHQYYTMHQYSKIALNGLEEDDNIRLHPIAGACVPRDKQLIHSTE